MMNNISDNTALHTVLHELQSASGTTRRIHTRLSSSSSWPKEIRMNLVKSTYQCCKRGRLSQSGITFVNREAMDALLAFTSLIALSEPSLATHTDVVLALLGGSYLLRMNAKGKKRIVRRLLAERRRLS